MSTAVGTRRHALSRLLQRSFVTILLGRRRAIAADEQIACYGRRRDAAQHEHEEDCQHSNHVEMYPSIPRASYRPARRRRSAFAITVTELNVMAALAIIGLSSTPKEGYSAPAATGTPSTL